MKDQTWIFSVRYAEVDDRDFPRWGVVGPAQASTVEAALHLAGVPEDVRSEIRADSTVRDFVEGKLDHEKAGYYAPRPMASSSRWVVCIGPVHAVLAGSSSKEISRG